MAPRSFLPATQHALAALGSQIAASRREQGWTAVELAERLGVGAQLIPRIERGVPSTSIGVMFEAAVVCGVPLFGVDAADLADVAAREKARLALLPARVQRREAEVSDDF